MKKVRRSDIMWPKVTIHSGAPRSMMIGRFCLLTCSVDLRDLGRELASPGLLERRGRLGSRRRRRVDELREEDKLHPVPLLQVPPEPPAGGRRVVAAARVDEPARIDREDVRRDTVDLV